MIVQKYIRYFYHFFLFVSIIFSVSVFADDTNWMSQIPDNRILNQLIIPGTHNSGSYDITSTSKFSLSDNNPLPTWIEQISNILPASLVRTIVAGWSKTQPYSITDQLNNGVRYLDFRVCDFESHLYLCHTLISARLKDTLQQIQTFVQNHPSEIILLDINHIYNVNNSADETQLVQLLQQYLGNIAVPNTYHTTDTIGTLRQSQRNVIIFMDTDQTINDPTALQFSTQYLWHERNINSPWPNVSDIGDLKNILDSEVACRAKTYMSTNNFFVLQAIKTENTSAVINGIINPQEYPNSIQTYETALNGILNSWLSTDISTYGQRAINIVIQDWLMNPNPVVALAVKYDTQPIANNRLKDDAMNAKLAELKKWYRSSTVR